MPIGTTIHQRAGRQPVQVMGVCIGSEGPRVLEYSWPRGDEEKVSVKEKTIQNPPQRRTPRPRGTLVKCRRCTQTRKHTHTHTHASQLHSDETPTARQSVMTHAVIAFPPAVSNYTGNSGVHHHHRTATAGWGESGLKRLMMTNTTAEMDPSLSPQMATKPPLMEKWFLHTMESTFTILVLQSTLAESELEIVP